MKKLLLLFILTLSTTTHALTVLSNAAASNSFLPVAYTCDGADLSPQVAWMDSPAGTRSYVLIVSDPDAPGGTFYHWILFNIPANVKDLPLGSVNPPGSLAGRNSFGKNGYKGPCPPKGSSHRYIFTVYALDNALLLKEDADAEAVMNAMKAHVLQKADYTMVYSRLAS